LVRPPFAQVLDLPHKRGEAALAWWTEEVRALAAQMAACFNVDLGETAVRSAIAAYNRWLAVMRRIAESRKSEHPPISGEAFVTLMAASAAAPKDTLLPEIEALAASLAAAPPLEGHRARVLLVGSNLDDPAYVRAIESTGALVVAERFCLGPCPEFAAIPEDGDPLANLAAHYLDATPCPRMMGDFERRTNGLLRLARDFRVDGVIIETMKFCDLWGIEALTTVKALRAAGLPTLRLEREYALSGEGQLRTRVQAFLESMGK
jgi:benzoyl-CoA reductase/2-hydroxyglutaryl-CoA dehydratase subunit BcrC/BadD/HgdB